MKTLITGATGFIGSRLAERASSAGHEVVAFGAERTALESARRRGLEANGIRVVVGMLEDTRLLRDIVRGAEAVFHLAAAQHESNRPEKHFYAVNVEGTRNLLAACAAEGTRRFVYGSTIGVYGSAENGELDEQSTTRPENAYGMSKLEAERVVESRAAELPYTIIRISETYGPGDRRLLKLFKLVAKGRFPMIGAGMNEHQPVYVDDLVDGLLLAASNEHARAQTFVLAGGEVLTTCRIVELVAEALGKPLRRVRLPLQPLLLAATVLETTLPPLGIAPPLHRRRLDFFVKRFYFSQHKAASLLGYSPKKSFREGAADTAAWYSEQGYL